MSTTKHEANHEKVHRHSYAIHWQRRKRLANTEPKEQIEQAQLQHEVEGVGKAKANAILYVSLFFECEMSGKNVVEQETDEITNTKGDTRIYNALKRKVYDIVECCCADTHYGKAEYFKYGSLIYLHLQTLSCVSRVYPSLKLEIPLAAVSILWVHRFCNLPYK